MRSTSLIAPASFAALLLAVAEGCTQNSSTSRDCPPVVEVKSVDAASACRTLAGPKESDNGEVCTVEKEFADLFDAANAKVIVNPQDASIDAAPDAMADAGASGDAGDAPKTTNVCPAFDRPVKVSCSYTCVQVAGRPFAGFEAPAMTGASATHFFEACAYTEAASVDAFYILATELRALGAPSALSDACVRAARDEQVHAAMMSRLAGIPEVFVSAPSMPLRGARELALENARSGLVNETFAAVLNQYQSIHAVSTEVRGTLQQIAADESRHAHLSRRIHVFLCKQLSPSEVADVEAAQHQAIADLERHIRETAPPLGDAVLGLPGRARQLALLEGLRSHVWALDAAA